MKTVKITIIQGALPDDTGWWTKEDWDKHDAHVKELKEKGELFKPKEVTVNYMPCPLFDEPSPKQPALENYKIMFLDLS